MTIDWNNFTPWSSLLGGALIGAAAALFIVFNGRIAGISGVLGGLLRPASLAPGDAGWRVTFVLGLLVAPLVYLLLAAWPAVQVGASYGASSVHSSSGLVSIASAANDFGTTSPMRPPSIVSSAP